MKYMADIIAAFSSSPGSRTALRDIVGALADLNQSGGSAWLSEYNDLVPVAGDDSAVSPNAPVPSRRERVAMIVFSGSDQAPDVVVDLSHTVGAGPSPD